MLNGRYLFEEQKTKSVIEEPNIKEEPKFKEESQGSIKEIESVESQGGQDFSF